MWSISQIAVAGALLRRSSLLAQQKGDPADLMDFPTFESACEACVQWQQKFKDNDYVQPNEHHCTQCHAGKSRCETKDTYMWACWDFNTLKDPAPCQGEFSGMYAPLQIKDGQIVHEAYTVEQEIDCGEPPPLRHPTRRNPGNDAYVVYVGDETVGGDTIVIDGRSYAREMENSDRDDVTECMKACDKGAGSHAGEAGVCKGFSWLDGKCYFWKSTAVNPVDNGDRDCWTKAETDL
jgi:hypothetical protein